jgi:hypothetical protein
MKTGISEFSYGFAFTNNFLSSYGPTLKAPHFPSLIDEAKLGYDVRLDWPGEVLIFQFKVPVFLGSKAKQHSLFGQSYFRYSLHQLGKQHNVLFGVANEIKDCVFYASPDLVNVQEFHSEYTNENITNRSVFIDPLDIGRIADAKPHTISYSKNCSHAYFCSEPRRIRILKRDSILELTRAKLKVRKTELMDDLLKLNRQLGLKGNVNLRQLSTWLRVHQGAMLFILQDDRL